MSGWMAFTISYLQVWVQDFRCEDLQQPLPAEWRVHQDTGNPIHQSQKQGNSQLCLEVGWLYTLRCVFVDCQDEVDLGKNGTFEELDITGHEDDNDNDAWWRNFTHFFVDLGKNGTLEELYYQEFHGQSRLFRFVPIEIQWWIEVFEINELCTPATDLLCTC